MLVSVGVLVTLVASGWTSPVRSALAASMVIPVLLSGAVLWVELIDAHRPKPQRRRRGQNP